jgi:hypothetical protein
VQRPKTPDQLRAVDPDHLTIGKNSSEEIERNSVVRIVKGGHQDQLVGDIKICVAGRQPPAIKNQGKR